MPPFRIFLTGANGYLGSHILRQLLPYEGLSVRAVVRSESKVQDIQHDFPASSNLDFAIVPDITAPDAFKTALIDTEQSLDAVIHTASPFWYKVVTNNSQLIDAAVSGTMGILRDVETYAPGVERVVITSSLAAVGDLAHTGRMNGHVYTETDWNPVTLEEALRGDLNTAYHGSKNFAEQAAWKFRETEKPQFDIVTICPPMIYGPLAHTVKKTTDLNQSSFGIHGYFMNGGKDAPLPPDELYLYVDPREIAAAHIAALFTPGTGDPRFVVSAGQISSQTISDVLRAKFPEPAERTPIERPGVSSISTSSKGSYSSSSAKAEKVLGVKFRSLEETLTELVAQLLAIEKTEKA